MFFLYQACSSCFPKYWNCDFQSRGRADRNTSLAIVAVLASIGGICSNARAGADEPPKPELALQRPNIVVLLCDDLGFGDVHALAPATCKIPTPNIDQLAGEGTIFDDAHSPSSVCTPTRYGLLTGRYAWRTKLQRGVVTGFAPSLIAEDRPTIGNLLQEHGYHTGVVGKWHLNFQYVDPQTAEPLQRNDHKLPPVNSTIPDGPLTRGFDYFFGFHHARDMRAVIENDRVTEHDDPEQMLPRIEEAAVQYIANRAQNEQPFFLYVPFGSPHTPIVPTEEWKGRSGLGDYADFVMQTDDAVGKIVGALDENHMRENTLVIFSSDNGCSKAAGIEQLAQLGHKVSGSYRGSKADLWEGGHRVPFIASWPGHVAAGQRCSALIGLQDCFATFAELLDVDIPAGSCEDSISFLPVLLGTTQESARGSMIFHSVSGHFAIREGPYKLLLAGGSGGWTSPREAEISANQPAAQLYFLPADIAEQKNLLGDSTSIRSRLLKRLRTDVNAGRSTAGRASENDVSTIRLWKTRQPNWSK